MEDNDWCMFKVFIHTHGGVPAYSEALELPDLTKNDLFLPKPFYYSAVLCNFS